jgi:hypothetical protein
LTYGNPDVLPSNCGVSCQLTANRSGCVIAQYPPALAIALRTTGNILVRANFHQHPIPLQRGHNQKASRLHDLIPSCTQS